ncbi:MAG: hypothetical protein OER77_03615, partial [Myxococcales bacterium]|nr:hypothetical protein [Myxococcales bacterium]
GEIGVRFETVTRAERYRAMGADAIFAGSQSGALWSLASAVVEDPEDPLALSDLGFILNYAGDYERAKVFLLRARFLDPSFHSARNNLCRYYIEVGDFLRAANECAWVAASQPYVVHYQTRLAEVYYAQGDIARAREVATRAVVVAPDDPRASALKKRIDAEPLPEPYIFMGDPNDYDAAQEVIEECLAIPEFDEAQRREDRLIEAYGEALQAVTDRLEECVFPDPLPGPDCDPCIEFVTWIHDWVLIEIELGSAIASSTAIYANAVERCAYEAALNRPGLSADARKAIIAEIQYRGAGFAQAEREFYELVREAYAVLSETSPPAECDDSDAPGESEGIAPCESGAVPVKIDVCPPQWPICVEMTCGTVTVYVSGLAPPFFVRGGATIDMRTGEFMVSFGTGVFFTIPFTNLEIYGGANTLWHSEHGIGVEGYVRTAGPLRFRAVTRSWTFENL